MGKGAFMKFAIQDSFWKASSIVPAQGFVKRIMMVSILIMCTTWRYCRMNAIFDTLQIFFLNTLRVLDMTYYAKTVSKVWKCSKTIAQNKRLAWHFTFVLEFTECFGRLIPFWPQFYKVSLWYKMSYSISVYLRTVVWPSYLIMVIILLVRRHLMGSRMGPNARRCHIVPVAGLWNTIDYFCRLCDWNKIYRILSHLTTAWSSHGISNDKKRGIYWRIMTLTNMSLMYKSYPVLRLS